MCGAIYAKEHIMDMTEAAKQRHSVRSFLPRGLDKDVQSALEERIRMLNSESGLNIQLVLNEPKAFGTSLLAHYGKFENVNNYIVLAGKKGRDLQEKCGYYGEDLVLFAQTLGLNTCWVALTYKKIKGAYSLEDGEKVALVIAIGYGKTAGKPHRSKTFADVAKAENPPEWFVRGVEGALLAPTAVNQQKFKFISEGNKVKALAGTGFYTDIDLGIAKYHFELFAGKENFDWA